MSKLFFGKISKLYSQQFDGNFYAGGKPGNSWYNGLQPGDYVFPIYNQLITKLWKVKGYDSTPNSINDEGSIQFEVVKTYPTPINISTVFTRCKYFELDLILVNKSVKSTASQKIGFFPISCTETCPPAEQIDLLESRNIYIAIENPFRPLIFKESDIRILINGKEDLRINKIQVFHNNNFVRYDILNDLYLSKNLEGQRYTLEELKSFANLDKAPNKESFLTAVINGIKHDGFFIVTNPVALYDNILVGRKKTSIGKIEERISAGEAAEEDLLEREEIPISNYENYKEYVDLLNFSPNLILYGPPGTGKTYSAEKIIEAFDYDCTGKALSFDAIQAEGRVSFVTFHQSFSYEEFIEGLRPTINSDDIEINSDNNDDIEVNNGNHDNLKYKVQNGILKKMANKASLSQILSDNSEKMFSKTNENSRIWKISLGERYKEEWVYKSCILTKTIAIGWFDDTDLSGWNYKKIFSRLKKDLSDNDPKPTNNAHSIDNFVNELQEGDIVMVFAGQTAIRAIGMVDGPYEWKSELQGKYAHRRSVKWLKIFDDPINIIEYNSGKKLSQKTLYELTSLSILDVYELLTPENKSTKVKSKEIVPYYLIIDEINRGNISKIFGELITLVEKDKRDKIKVVLPYSQKPFSLPANLYLIGTMNTADRSIAILDTALRRRFLFKEIEPNIEVIRESDYYIIENDLDLSKLAETLNVRISKKLDRDHRLGHSYFMDIYDLDQFRIRWYYQIIPLLMEYFYNDAESIEEIISSKFIDKSTSRILWIQDNKEFKQALININ